ncbi:MAG: glycine--tRNA ligase subunit alpha [Syntrophaceae bacterium]|nr:glycine--tRNA ligase subunit alpha [Syntrophaceae bacterium]MBP9651093.1 glycine--tRNA ligase subunit alpha [Syntrophaceae bacterium]
MRAFYEAVIFSPEKYRHSQGCVIRQPWDMEVGAGTFSTLRNAP